MIRTPSLIVRCSLILCVMLSFHLARAEDKREACVVQLGKPTDATVSFWLESSLKRVYLKTPPGSTNLHLLAARNSRISFQACVRNERAQPGVECQVSGADDLKPRVRLVGLVPLTHFTPNTDPKEL